MAVVTGRTDERFFFFCIIHSSSSTSGMRSYFDASLFSFFFFTFLICKICVTGEWTAPDTLALDSMTAHIPCIVHCTSARAGSNKTGLSRRETFIFCLHFLSFFGQQAKNNDIVLVSVHLIEILKRLFLFSLGSSTSAKDTVTLASRHFQCLHHKEHKAQEQRQSSDRIQ